MIETAAELIGKMKSELDRLSSWYIPVSVDGKPILDVELVEKGEGIEMEIKTE